MNSVKKGWIVWVIIIFIVIMSIVIWSNIQKTANENKFWEIVANRNLTEAVSMYKGHYADDVSKRDMLQTELSNYLEEVSQRYLNNEITYNDVAPVLDEIEGYEFDAIAPILTQIRSTIEAKNEEDTAEHTFTSSIEEHDFGTAVEIYNKYYRDDEARTSVLQHEISEYLEWLSAQYVDSAVTYDEAISDIGQMESFIALARLSLDVKDEMQSLTSKYINDITTDMEQQLQRSDAQPHAIYFTYLEKIENTLRNVRFKPFFYSIQSMFTSIEETLTAKYTDSAIEHADRLAAERNFERAVELLEQVGSRDPSNEFLRAKIDLISNLKPLNNVSQGIYIKDGNKYYALPGDHNRARQSTRSLDNAVLLQEWGYIPTLLKGDMLVEVGYGDETIKVFEVMKSGYIVSAQVINYSEETNKLIFKYFGSVSMQDIYYETINGKPKSEFNRYIDLVSRGFKERFIDAEMNEVFTLERLSGTTYVEHKVVADTQYLTFNSAQPIELPVTKTREGYFIIGTEKLEPGKMYIIDINIGIPKLLMQVAD